MNNERLTLMWHPSHTNTSERRASPQCVKVWIESGVYLNDGTFILPKLTWSKVSAVQSATTTTATTSSPTSRELLRPAKIQYSSTLEKLDLLDICRIYPLTKVNRAIHPFALTHKSFCIETVTEQYVFQAQTIEEKDRIVYGLKLVVARLASLLMLRDIRAAEEFFGAITNMVPGEAPQWVTMKDTSCSNNSKETTTGHTNTTGAVAPDQEPMTTTSNYDRHQRLSSVVENE
jgi:hypothetical protein